MIDTEKHTMHLDIYEKLDELETSHPSLKEEIRKEIAIKETLKTTIKALEPPGGQSSYSWDVLKTVLCTMIDYMELNV